MSLGQNEQVETDLKAGEKRVVQTGMGGEGREGLSPPRGEGGQGWARPRR